MLQEKPTNQLYHVVHPARSSCLALQLEPSSGASMRRAESNLLPHTVLQGEDTIREAAAGVLHREAPEKPPEVRDSPASMYDLGGQSQTQQRRGAPVQQGRNRWAAVMPCKPGAAFRPNGGFGNS